MKTAVLVFSSFAALVASAAAPAIKDVSIVQPAGARLATITYTLANAEAIVTLDIQKDGVSIGGRNFNGALCGEINRLVQPGTYTVTWDTYSSWPNRYYADSSVKAVVTAWRTDEPPDYMVLPIGGHAQRYYATAEDVPGGVEDEEYKTDALLMRRIHAKGRTFRMGSPRGETGRLSSEDGHLVSFTYDYWISVYEITQSQHEKAKGTLPASCGATGEDDSAIRPVTGCSYSMLCGENNDNDKRNWTRGSSGPLCKFRSDTGMEKLDLPTDAEWEFACRAGSSAAIGADGNATTNELGVCASLEDIAWYKSNSEGEIHPVGLKAPNAWGLYDMLGNAAEMVWDGYKASLGNAAMTDPFQPFTGGSGGVFRRGGSYLNLPGNCRAATRPCCWTSWHNFDNYQKTGANYATECGYRVAIYIP